jgi:iron complex outermembrane recepter protein
MYTLSYDANAPLLNGYPVQRYEPAWAIDLEGHVNLGTTVTLAIGGTDVFNRYPDVTTPGNSYGGSFPYNYANPLGINGAYYYMHLTVRFGK